MNINFAPVVDVNFNPDNPIIGNRSFGEDPFRVGELGVQYMKGMQDNKVLACAKHFPGHGSSSTDTHKELTDVSKSWRIEELFPYDKLIKTGAVTGIMSSHVVNNQLDESMLPGTLSKKMMTGILRDFLSYEGVIFSDDMQMSAITKHYGTEEAIIKAIDAGIDVLIFSNNQLPENRVTPEEIISIIERNIEDGRISVLRINESYERIINLKKKIKLIN